MRHQLCLTLYIILAITACSAGQQATPAPIATQAAPATTSMPTDKPAPTSTLTPMPTATDAPTSTPQPAITRFSIGQSASGNLIEAIEFGTGEHVLVFIGGIHGGYEANSTQLVLELIDHFSKHMDEILPNTRLIFIASANPDGYASGTDLAARFNANGVDLNRNWGCDWQPEAFIRDIPVSPGSEPFSEPETRALRDFLVETNPEAAVFYHSQLAEIFVGDCSGNDRSAYWLGEILSDATGYPFKTEFTAYVVSGDATNWLVANGIPAAIIELTTRTATDFDQNLLGVKALQCEIIRQATEDTGDMSSIFQDLCE